MDAVRLLRQLAFTTSTAGAVLVTACAQEEAPPPAEGFAAVAPGYAVNPSCPHDASFRVIRGSDTVTIDSMPVAGPIGDIPEFHDCQRLLRGQGNAYGTLAGLYASYRLDDLADVLDTIQGGRAFAAAAIFSWHGAYAPLGIRLYFNCLYVNRTPNGWRAWMVPVRTDGWECLKTYTPGSNPLEKRLRMSPDSGRFAGQDVPPVVRWDWNAENGTQTIGIKCGEQWCTVGDSTGYRAGRGYDVASLASRIGVSPGALPRGLQSNRVISVRGWYDEQRLAPAGNPGAPAATNLVATLFPDSLLRTRQLSDFQRLTNAAYVVIPADTNGMSQAVNGYSDKFNFTPGVNTIAICSEPGCLRRQQPLACNLPDEQIRFETQTWYARITSSTGRERDFCVRRCIWPDASGIQSTGTARWRWMADDEKIWISCATGCCQIEPN